MDLNLKLKGKMKLGNLEFNHIEGGFGKNQKCILAKDIAEIHKTEHWKINQAINRNRKQFIDEKDVIDLKDTDFAPTLCESKIFTQGSVNASKNIYLLSERGYLKLVKILKDAKAWEVYNLLLDDYFNMRKEKKELSSMDILENLNLQNSLIIEEMQSIKSKVNKVDGLEGRVEQLEDDMTINSRKQYILNQRAKSRVLHFFGGKESRAYKNNISLRTKVFSSIWKDYKDYIGVSTYKDTPEVMYKKGLEFLESWTPSGKVLREIEKYNTDLKLVK